MGKRRAWNRLAIVLGSVLFVIGATVAGMVIALNAASHDRQRISLGTVDTQVAPALDGRVSVYVPLVDWRVRVLDHKAPIDVRLELRGIDRGEASEGVSSANAASRSIAQLQLESTKLVEDTVRRGAIVATAGGLIGALIAGALLTSTRLKRRWLMIAPTIGVAVVAGLVIPSILELHRIEQADVTLTPSGGNAAELPAVLQYAAQLQDVGDEYAEHYETALESVANVAGFAARDADISAGEREDIYVISDFHDNAFVLDAFEQMVGEATVIGAGDWVQVGAKLEERLAPRLARLGGRFIAVSGNHDTESFMRSLADEGALVLDAESPYTHVGDLLVAGYPDPLERPDGAGGAHRLRVYGDEYVAQREAFVEWWDQLDERPDVVVVHQHGFAHALLHHLEEIGDDDPLLVLTGHDHRPHVHADGPHVIVDAGTLGAGGLAAVGSQSASFVRLELVDGAPVAAHVIEVEPLTGTTSSERHALPDAG